MNAIDGSERTTKTDDAPPPSLLAIVLDTNPHAWAHLTTSGLPLSSAIANLLVFINAHLVSNNANEVVVIASHVNKAVFLYPTPKSAAPSHHANGDVDMDGTEDEAAALPGNANKYRPFALVENAIRSNLEKLMSGTKEKDVSATPTTLIGGALSVALSYIAKSTLLANPIDTTSTADTGLQYLSGDAETTQAARIPLTSRILIVSVSGDLANQYIPVMNSIFAAQRQRIAIDIMKLAGDTVLLQQACDATGGIYMKPERPEGLLQYLLMGFLPDATARKSLVMPSAGGVDFRAACFCHRKVVDVGYVCSVCLSIFCEPNLPDNLCLTCGSYLSLSSAVTATPALLPRKKKKKKRAIGDSATPGGSTPSRPGTPLNA